MKEKHHKVGDAIKPKNVGRLCLFSVSLLLVAVGLIMIPYVCNVHFGEG